MKTTRRFSSRLFIIAKALACSIFIISALSARSQLPEYESPPILTEEDLIIYLRTHGQAEFGSPADPLSYLTPSARRAL